MSFQRSFTAAVFTLLVTWSLPAQNQVSLTVDSTMDVYRAGGYNDGSDGTAPVVFNFPARDRQTMALPSVGGAWNCHPGAAEFAADGETSGYCLIASGPTNFGSIGTFSGYRTTDFVGGLVGVFLEDTLPASAPSALRFYVNSSSSGGIRTDFTTLSPKIGQVFFVGDGLTGDGSGETQTFSVPPTATHLYLGYIDNCANQTVPGCFSGNTGSIDVTVRLQEYVPDWVKPTSSSAPSARISAAMTYDAARHTTLLFGGNSAYGPGATYGDTWVWSNGWTQLSPTTSPAPRGGAGMVYDPTTGTVVLFGGVDNTNGSFFDDTWTWDGVTWTQQFPAVSPPARSPSAFGMVYDAARETVVLFGGYGPTADYGDTWEWDGRTGTWTQKFPQSSPSPRGTSLSYDAIDRAVVLFGGENGSPFFGDTWTWNGVDWTQQFPPSSPSARTRQTMAYDPDLSAVVLFGGTGGPPESLNDTWAWTGTTWKQLTPATSPSSRYVSSMDFDPISDGLVLFGGEVSGNIVTNQTWLYKLVPVP